MEYRTSEATAFFAPLLGSELVALEGLQTRELFEWNVRQSLGRTKVNKARELKSASAVREFAQQIVPMYEKALKRGRVSSFAEEWQESSNA